MKTLEEYTEGLPEIMGHLSEVLYVAYTQGYYDGLKRAAEMCDEK